MRFLGIEYCDFDKKGPHALASALTKHIKKINILNILIYEK